MYRMKLYTKVYSNFMFRQDVISVLLSQDKLNGDYHIPKLFLTVEH